MNFVLLRTCRLYVEQLCRGMGVVGVTDNAGIRPGNTDIIGVTLWELQELAEVWELSEVWDVGAMGVTGATGVRGGTV